MSAGSPTIRQALIAAASTFRAASVATPELDARLLLCHAAGIGHEAYVARPERELEFETATRFAAMVRRRLEGEPVSRIVGCREFYGRSFIVDEAVLDPRPDTETLIDAALEVVARNGWRTKPITLLDLGTGTGCILLTLLAELPSAQGVGADSSAAALRVAQANAQALGVAGRAAFVAGDWLEPVTGAFDLIVANPPYLTAEEMAGPSPEVRHDPPQALSGGTDGLGAYRHIALRACETLRPGGTILLEVGSGQADAVLSLLRAGGLKVEPGRCLWRDLAGRARCVAATVPPRQPVAARAV